MTATRTAQVSTELDDFPTLTQRYQRELLAHCYRMTGSVHEAEDLVQETYLRAWRAYHGFEGRSSVRTWLYRIVTNLCYDRLPRLRGDMAALDPDEALDLPDAGPALEGAVERDSTCSSRRSAATATGTSGESAS